MRDRALGQSDRFGEVADARFAAIAPRDQGEQHDPGRIAHCLEHAGDTLGILVGERRGHARHAAVGLFDGRWQAHGDILARIDNLQ